MIYSLYSVKISNLGICTPFSFPMVGVGDMHNSIIGMWGVSSNILNCLGSVKTHKSMHNLFNSTIYVTGAVTHSTGALNLWDTFLHVLRFLHYTSWVAHIRRSNALLQDFEVAGSMPSNQMKDVVRVQSLNKLIRNLDRLKPSNHWTYCLHPRWVH